MGSREGVVGGCLGSAGAGAVEKDYVMTCAVDCLGSSHHLRRRLLRELRRELRKASDAQSEITERALYTHDLLRCQTQ